MRILFVMDQRVDRGSIQSVSNYVRAGDKAGHEIALYGRTDPRFPTIRFSMAVGMQAQFAVMQGKYREFIDFGSTIGIFRPKAPSKSMPYRQIPYATEQGIKWAAAGN